ncbi:hypothetical protein QFZ22_000194 [Streptomyces canus]|uniref:Uncharacterized protein n=1 Tax=Streptomyces canus TaxID=58343 RepID=A0AAW8F335_9ACTN|nr:hypothetical protein [Streptomyces canus]MDQ0904209.1 hypothetical protein [Streptomyces canus]
MTEGGPKRRHHSTQYAVLAQIPISVRSGMRGCTAPGVEFRNALTEFCAEHHRHHAALAQIKEAQERRAGILAEIDQLDARIGDLLAEDLHRDLDGE